MSSPPSKNQEYANAVQKAGSRYGALFMLVHQALADRLGLNIIDLRCLRLARETGDPTAGQLAKITGLTTGTMTGVLDRLERAKFIRRERDTQDRRKVTIRVLPGVQQIEMIMQPLSRDMNNVLHDFSEEELRAVLKFFELTAGAVARHIERIHQDKPSKRKRKPLPIPA